MDGERELAAALVSQIEKAADQVGHPVRIMEVCGTHTVELRKQGIHSLLPAQVTLISGPGCPVCVTPTGYVDNALALAESGRAVIASFGDMLKVPGSSGRSLSALGAGARVKLVYSPSDLLRIAEQSSGVPVVFLAVGFETTIPTILTALAEARARGIRNLSFYTSFKTVPPALKFLLSNPEHGIDGFLLPGHVSVIIGAEAYRFLEQPGGKPGVITGFAALEMLLGILMIMRQLAAGRSVVENAYPHAVRPEGNTRAQELMARMLQPRNEAWRGLGVVPGAALGLRPELEDADAARIFSLPAAADFEVPGCICSRVVAGMAVPTQCALFGKRCTPDDPVGPCMVSSEGTCAAYFRYGGDR